MAAPAIPTHPTSLPLFPSVVSIIIIIIFFFFFPSLSQSSDSPYDTCTPFDCGNIRNITFPFSSSSSFTTSDLSCGPPDYKISCDASSGASITLSDRPYQLKSLSPFPENIMVVSDLPLVSNIASFACKSIQNLSLPSSQIAPLTVPQWGTYLKFYRCPLVPDIPLEKFVQPVHVYGDCKDDVRLYLVRNLSEEFPIAPSGCLYFKVPVLLTSLIANNLTLRSTSSSTTMIKELNRTVLMDVLGKGFSLQWPDVGDCSDCSGKGGRCGFQRDSAASNMGSGKVKCLYRETGTGSSKSSSKRQIIIGTTVTSAFVVLVIVAFLTFKFRHKATSILNKDYFKSKRSKENDRNMVEFINNYRSTLVAKYSYSDIYKMTNGFKDKLGEGGYGNVFKGKLADGRLVAAKMLEKLHDNGQDFVNEVATIGTIHHVNVIRLLGFCWEGSRRALVYEFMPNGSLGDLISKEDAAHFIGWPKLLEIALGIAHGIDYLHQGCDTRILHLDIKPHNVLLDENYDPKISDFGLAKSYSRMQNVVSITNAKGTIGYIAPEMFLRNLGGVSHKSDVYSYGMLLLEMVGGKKSVKVKVEYSSSTYFPNWMYNQLEQDSEMEIIDSIVEEDLDIAKKMVMVGLWCVQLNPSDRPTMSRVAEMLTGSVEGIEMPPKPFLFSPPRSQAGHVVSVTENYSNDMPLMFDST
ncbi:rust resistance kinase Lr10-like protein [Cinnamomum micranthum f. kanehirae]|uniref:Rust resistance kinase Lr10-like protein n=1 Tax=Cinnamomum micranthum f. kanehirae TaxID=337451 RepID=A0A3S3R1H1_9MAGN|nr:rust resistance kinase Lr10-like protein [Cinnamomum micranthum f. kanehirae]